MRFVNAVFTEVCPISGRRYISGRLTVMKFFHDLLLCLFTLQINVNILLIWISLDFLANIPANVFKVSMMTQPGWFYLF